jgi:hypothetical protein
MRMRNRWIPLLFGKWAVATVALAGFLALTGVPKVHADDDCQRRISHADHRLHEAIEHYGYQSRQADEARHELHEERERCYKANSRWWDEDQHRWHSDRDWDDHDHDRDRRRDNDDDHR